MTLTEKKIRDLCSHYADWYPSVSQIRELIALAQPEQGPVEWNVVDPTGKIVATEMNSVRGWARIEGYKPTVEGLLGFHEQGWRVVPTTPPKRKPLTDEEIEDIWKQVISQDNGRNAHLSNQPFVHIARAIEAAHGIKE